MVDFVGCPPRSTFNPSTLECDCQPGEIYSTESFECIELPEELLQTKEPINIPEDEIIEEKSGDKDGSSEAALFDICFVLHFLIIFVVYCFTY